MKRILSITMVLSLALFMFAGCGSTGSTTAPTSAAPSTETSAAPSSSAPAETTDNTVKTGLGIVSSIAKSAEPGEKDGLAEVDSMIAAVTVDKDGKIVKCVIDAAQTKINFSKEGKILTDVKSEFKTKQELKTEYGMLKNSKIGKEWNEQADAFAAYVVGKTVEEVKGIAVSAEGTAADTELSSSVTVHIGDFIAAVEKAVNNAQDFGAKAGDKLGLGVTTNIAKSADVTADKEGLAQAYSIYTASTFAEDGKVTSCVIDASQSNVNFDKTGKITTDLKAALQSKDELKENYGMKKASKIGKEWYEEAAAFAQYVTGKTLDEIKGIAVSAEGVPTAAELTGSVTVHIGDFQAVIEKASTTAK
jgi:predicted small lipoprotein YifL